MDAALGSYVPFDARIHKARGQSGQVRVAELYRGLLDNSELNRSHADCDRVQDPLRHTGTAVGGAPRNR